MTAFLTGLRLGHRRSVIGVAIFAAIICGLGSSVMQELASSQKVSFEDQVAFKERVDQRCSRLSADERPACRKRGPAPSGIAAFGAETDQLVARAGSLQTVGGSLNWAQTWLLTLLGVAALLVAVTVTASADLEKRRLTAGWHPRRASLNPFLAAAGAGISASAIVAIGAIVGSVTALIVGKAIWPLGGPGQVQVPGLDGAALLSPSLGGVLGILGVVAVLILVSWFAARTIATLLIGVSLFGMLVLMSSVLPAWMPGVSLPATAGMWFHHRGEIIHIWQWPTEPFHRGMPLFDWTALAETDPGDAARFGAVLLLALALMMVPVAVRRRLQ